MARIPLGNFGYKVADNAPRGPALPMADLVDTGLNDLATGMGKLAKTVQDEETAQQKLRDEEKKALEKTTASALWVEHENSVLGAANETVNKLKTGEIGRDEAKGYFTKLVDDSANSVMGNIAPALQGPTQVKFAALANRVARTVQSAIEVHQRTEIAGNMEAIRDGMLKQASIPGASLDKLLGGFEEAAYALGPQAGLDAARVGKVVQDFKDNATFAHLKQRVIGSADSIKALQSIEAEIKTHPGLDSDKRLALMSTTQSQITALTHRQAIEAERRDKANTRSWEAALDIVQAGKPLSADYAAKLQRQFQGTPYAQPLRELIHREPQNLAFAAQPLRVQDQALLEMQATGNRDGWNPAQQKQFEQFDKVYRKTLQEVREDPWRAGVERGVIREVSPLNPLDLANLPKALAVRAPQADALAVWSGQDVSLLRPDEAQIVGTALQTLPAAQRAEAMGALSRNMTPAQARALASQLDEKHPTLAVAGLLTAQNMTTPKGRKVAELYLKGVDALKEKRVTFDDGAQNRVRQEIYRQVEGAYATEAGTRTAVEAAFSVYAGLKSEGLFPNVDDAVKIATGGIMDLNGGRIVKPNNWSDGQVRDALRAVTPERVRNLFGEGVFIGGEPMKTEDFAKALPRARLVGSPVPSSYGVIVGGRMATDAQNRPLLLPLEAR